MAVFIQALPDGRHTAIHHIRGSNHIRPCLYLGQSGFGQKRKRLVIVHLVSAEHAAVSVGGIFAHTYVCYIIKVREPLLGLPKGSLDDTVLCVRAASHFILFPGDPEQHDTAHACARHFLQTIGKHVDTVTVLSFHGRDLFFYSLSLSYKYGIDQG